MSSRKAFGALRRFRQDRLDKPMPEGLLRQGVVGMLMTPDAVYRQLAPGCLALNAERQWDSPVDFFHLALARLDRVIGEARVQRNLHRSLLHVLVLFNAVMDQAEQYLPSEVYRDLRFGTPVGIVSAVRQPHAEADVSLVHTEWRSDYALTGALPLELRLRWCAWLCLRKTMKRRRGQSGARSGEHRSRIDWNAWTQTRSQIAASSATKRHSGVSAWWRELLGNAGATLPGPSALPMQVDWLSVAAKVWFPDNDTYQRHAADRFAFPEDSDLVAAQKRMVSGQEDGSETGVQAQAQEILDISSWEHFCYRFSYRFARWLIGPARSDAAKHEFAPPLPARVWKRLQFAERKPAKKRGRRVRRPEPAEVLWGNESVGAKQLPGRVSEYTVRFVELYRQAVGDEVIDEGKAQGKADPLLQASGLSTNTTLTDMQRQHVYDSASFTYRQPSPARLKNTRAGKSGAQKEHSDSDAEDNHEIVSFIPTPATTALYRRARALVQEQGALGRERKSSSTRGRGRNAASSGGGAAVASSVDEFLLSLREMTRLAPVSREMDTSGATAGDSDHSSVRADDWSRVDRALVARWDAESSLQRTWQHWRVVLSTLLRHLTPSLLEVAPSRCLAPTGLALSEYLDHTTSSHFRAPSVPIDAQADGWDQWAVGTDILNIAARRRKEPVRAADLRGRQLGTQRWRASWLAQGGMWVRGAWVGRPVGSGARWSAFSADRQWRYRRLDGKRWVLALRDLHDWTTGAGGGGHAVDKQRMDVCARLIEHRGMGPVPLAVARTLFPSGWSNRAYRRRHPNHSDQESESEEEQSVTGDSDSGSGHGSGDESEPSQGSGSERDEEQEVIDVRQHERKQAASSPTSSRNPAQEWPVRFPLARPTTSPPRKTHVPALNVDRRALASYLEDEPAGILSQGFLTRQTAPASQELGSMTQLLEAAGKERAAPPSSQPQQNWYQYQIAAARQQIDDGLLRAMTEVVAGDGSGAESRTNKRGRADSDDSESSDTRAVKRRDIKQADTQNQGAEEKDDSAGESGESGDESAGSGEHSSEGSSASSSDEGEESAKDSESQPQEQKQPASSAAAESESDELRGDSTEESESDSQQSTGSVKHEAAEGSDSSSSSSEGENDSDSSDSGSGSGSGSGSSDSDSSTDSDDSESEPVRSKKQRGRRRSLAWRDETDVSEVHKVLANSGKSCPQCDHTPTARDPSLHAHFRDKHGEKRTFVCTVCEPPRRYGYMGSLVTHVYSHHLKVKPVICLTCEASSDPKVVSKSRFSDRQSVAKHIRSKHS